MVKLPYGEKYLSFKAPPNAKILTPKKTRPIADPKKYAQRKISAYFKENQSSFRGFRDKKACVVVSHNTRFALNHVILPPLLKELEAIGITRNAITILVANGLPAPMNRADLIENLGKEIISNFNIEKHNPDGSLASCEVTSRGTPLFFSKRFIESDLKIATGLVAPHFHAGFGGGYKSILIGIAGKATTLKNHSFQMMAHSNTRYWRLKGNPVYEDIVEGGQKSGLQLIVNVTLGSDRKMTHLFIGELMIKAGGVIILVSACRDGVGHQAFHRYMSFGKDPQDVLRKIISDEPVEDQDKIQILARVLSKARAIIGPGGIEAEPVRNMKMELKSVEEAIGRSIQSGKDPRIAIVPGGPYVLPVGV